MKKQNKKKFTFTLDPDFIETAKNMVETDTTLKYASFNHFVEAALAHEFEAFKKTIKN